MKAIFPVLALCLLTGCHTNRIGISVTDNGTRVRLANTSGHALHHVRMTVYIHQPGIMHYDKQKFEQLDFDWIEKLAYQFPPGISAVEIYGWCSEGRVRGDWWGVEPVE